MSPRTIVYIDGFNLYYGAIRGTREKWLDLQKMCERLRQNDQVLLIKYFTAMVDGATRANQETYLKALATSPKVRVFLGKFKKKTFTCRVACGHTGSKEYIGTEEKRTDVNIAVNLLDDVYQDLADCFVIISGDSDLVPALSIAKSRFPLKKLVVYVPSRHPTRGAAVELRGAADKNRTLPLDLIKRSQFPQTLTDSTGVTIKKPASW
jgi:uncharacterized LabA/DUF88 family protein